MQYKGYEVFELYNGTFAIDCPAGCMACEEKPQPGHFACDSMPDELIDDPNIDTIFFDNTWYAILLDTTGVTE